MADDKLQVGIEEDEGDEQVAPVALLLAVAARRKAANTVENWNRRGWGE